jgi:CRISPR/Cas system endoribonuclease Cas6 (RAMP superfamily)
MSTKLLFASDAEKTIAKLRSEVDRLRHMRSGTYNFRIEQVRLMATAIEEIERGQTQYGLRMMIEVMDDLRPDWRSL